MDIEVEFQNLIDKINLYMPSTCNIEQLKAAYEIAKDAHSKQKRLGGQPFITHPLAVAHILANMEMDCPSIIAAMLHDCIEDTDLTYQDIKDKFGEQISDLVEGVTKLGKIPYSSKEEQQMENLRKMFLAMAKDVRVILIKLADRLHNMRTIESMPEDKQREKALETMEVYSPLAHRLGISKIKTELEDLSIKCLDPVGCREIQNYLLERSSQTGTFVDTMKTNIYDRVSQYGVKCVVEGRQKHLYSIYRKIYCQNRSFEEIYDLFAVRVIVDSVIDCYNVLGIIHDMYRPIPGRFKDYISTPKPNMYQSLHTTLIGKEGVLFEVQIRTWEMHKTAEYGIAAHWKYKTGVTSTGNDDEKLLWIRQLLEIQRDATDPEDFMRALKIDMFADEVFVFTPKGDVINLPSGATIIDFAYAIHSAVGNRMMGAKVNGKMLHLDYVLKNGDVVQIITSSTTPGPSLDWLKISKTSEARNKIRQWFKKEKREENIIRGREEFERELKRSGISMAQFTSGDMLGSIFKKFHVNSVEELYAGIGYGGISIHNVILRINHELDRVTKSLQNRSVEEIKKQIDDQSKKPRKASNGVIIEGVDNVLVKFARCCNPLPGDEIIGYITKGFGVSVHKQDCINATSSMANESESDRWIPVYWENSVQNTFTSAIQIVSRERMDLLADVVNLISNMRIPMHSLNSRDSKDGFTVINLKLEISNVDQLNSIMRKLQKVDAVIDVSRSNQ